MVDTPPRDALRAVQTPQTFEAELIRRAHAAYALGERATDDAALAERMGVKQASVSAWESGQAMPSAANLLKLADILDCTVDELLGRKKATA